MTRLMDLRRKNLRMLVEQWGGPSNLAKKLGYSGPSYVSQMIGGNRPITEKTARSIEEVLGLTSGVLDLDHKNSKPTVDNNLVTKVIMAVGTKAGELGITVAPHKFADIVTIVYEDAIKRQDVDESYVERIVKLLSK